MPSGAGSCGQSAACSSPSACKIPVHRRDARVAEGGALLRRYTGLNPYRGFESLSLRQSAFCSTSLLSSASFLRSTQRLLTTPLLLTTPFLSTWGSEPLVRGRFVGKAPHIQPVLSRDQFDVLVRKPELPGITQQRDAPRRRGCKLAEVLDQPVPLELKYRFRQTHRDQDARALALPARADDRLEKGFRFLDCLPAE